MKTLELRYSDHHGKSYCWTPDKFLEVVRTREINHREVIGGMIMKLHDMYVLEEYQVVLKGQDTVPDWVLEFYESKYG